MDGDKIIIIASSFNTELTESLARVADWQMQHRSCLDLEKDRNVLSDYEEIIDLAHYENTIAFNLARHLF